MRRFLAVAVSGGLLAAALATPAVAIGATTDVDCGSGADLQAAIDAASPGDTLAISGTCVGSFTVGKELNLHGMGSDPTIAGGPTSTDQVLIAPEGTVSRLTISGGIGVGIWNRGGHLVLRDVTVRDNGGGGILLDGPLTMIRSAVLGNGSAGIQSGSHAGGQPVDIRLSSVRDNGGAGIVNWAPLTLTDSTVSDNVGVGLWNLSNLSGRGQLTVIRSTISGNTGGGIENRWELSISESKVINNTTAGYGGGIWNRYEGELINFRGVLTMSDSKVTGNTAGIDGGGIYNSGPPSVVTLDSVKFKNNAPNDCTGC